MAIITGSFATYSAVGNREDLADIIYNISPTETPFMSAIGRGKANAIKFEWQTDSLASASTTNAQLEGDEITVSTSTSTTRVDNYVQISNKSLAVTGTQEAVDKAGRDSEFAYLAAKRGKELKRDMESILTQNQGYVAGNATTARKTRSLESWLTTNDSRGTSGTEASAATAAATDGTQRTLTEAILKAALQTCWDNGADPKIIMVGSYNKQVISGFTGRSISQTMVKNNAIVGAADLYVSDFGELKVVPNRFQRSRTAFLLDPEYALVAYLRSFKTEDLATVGDSKRKFMVVEYGLKMHNEAAHGVIADLNTAST